MIALRINTPVPKPTYALGSLISPVILTPRFSLLRPHVLIGFSVSSDQRGVRAMTSTSVRLLTGCLLLFAGSLSAATITVNDAGFAQSDDGVCTFAEAIDAVNNDTASGVMPGECAAGGAEDTIEFDLPLPAVIDQPFMLNVNRSVVIEGPGKDLLSISGNGISRILRISNVALSEFTIRGLTFTAGLGNDNLLGYNPSGGAVIVDATVSPVTFEDVRFENSAAAFAGGGVALVNASSSLSALRTFRRCHFVGNSAQGSVINEVSGNTGGGGGLYIGANVDVLIEDTTFENNFTLTNGDAPSADGETQGGAIWMVSASPAATSELLVRRSTFSGNTAVGLGGGLAIGLATATDDYSVVTMRHSTITDNHADSNDNGIANSGGGIYALNGASVTLANNLLAANRTGAGTTESYDLRGTFNSTGYNLVGDNRGAAASFPAGTPNANDDTVGAGPLGIIDPGVNSLGMYGGPTPTHSLGITSPAIDQGSCTNQTADQRGYGNSDTGFRPIDIPTAADLDDGCDIGAFERLGTSSNEPPVANDDSYTVLEDVLFEATDLDGQATAGDPGDDGVLANDTDAESSLVVSSGGSFQADGLGGDVVLAADGGFSYQGPADQSGAASFEYTASDGSESDTATVSLTVLPVNDAPSYTAASVLIEVDESAGAQTVSDWASNIDPGAPDESGQQLTFVFNNPQHAGGFFSQPPFINPVSGDLIFTVTNGVTGSAFFSVVLTDDGGTDNGGVDTSQAVDLEIRVNSTGTSADLSITKSNGVDAVDPQNDTTWTLQINNSGPDPVTGVTVEDLLPAAIVQASWMCQANPQASCTTSGAQSGDVHETLNLTVGGAVQITIQAEIDDAATGTLVNTATLTLPDGVSDPTPEDLTSTDSDALQTGAAIFEDGFEVE